MVDSFEQDRNVLAYLIIIEWNHLELTNPELEDVKGVFVDEFQFVHESDGEFHHGSHMSVRHLNFLQGAAERLLFTLIHACACACVCQTVNTLFSSPTGVCVSPVAAM